MENRRACVLSAASAPGGYGKSRGGTLVLSRPLEEQGALARLKRYFFIGESTINYASALTHALHFYRQVSQPK